MKERAKRWKELTYFDESETVGGLQDRAVETSSFLASGELHIGGNIPISNSLLPELFRFLTATQKSKHYFKPNENVE